MNHPAAMRVLHSAAGLFHHIHHILLSSILLFCPLVDRQTVDIFHGEKRNLFTGGISRIINPGNPRMFQQRSQPNLAVKPIADPSHLRLIILRHIDKTQLLQGHRSALRPFPRLPHQPHSAGPDFFQQCVIAQLPQTFLLRLTGIRIQRSRKQLIVAKSRAGISCFVTAHQCASAGRTIVPKKNHAPPTHSSTVT